MLAHGLRGAPVPMPRRTVVNPSPHPRCTCGDRGSMGKRTSTSTRARSLASSAARDPVRCSPTKPWATHARGHRAISHDAGVDADPVSGATRASRDPWGARGRGGTHLDRPRSCVDPDRIEPRSMDIDAHDARSSRCSRHACVTFDRLRARLSSMHDGGGSGFTVCIDEQVIPYGSLVPTSGTQPDDSTPQRSRSRDSSCDRGQPARTARRGRGGGDRRG